ncbi:MAG: hypothetical protein P4L66_15430 [Acetobacteraceae bacterium]|nr:hypothetical protein [Acetobacteraceae bacterium]
MAPIFRLSYRVTDAEREERIAADNRRSVALSGLAITLALLVASLFLVQRLHKVSKIEDCLLSGRSNCDMLVQRLH